MNSHSAFKPRTRNRNFLLSVIMMTAKMLFVIVLLVGVVGTGLVVGVAKAWVETAPSLDLTQFDSTAQTSFIYDKYGNLITTVKGTENRIDVPLSQVPRNLINAVIAVEDQRFYSHNGIDVRRIVGAMVANLLNGNMQGGSTITQQLIKQTILTDEQTYKRKLQEAYLAIQLENVLTKEQILEEYLNVIYLGGSNYGVQVAAQDYFGKDVSDLTLRECAMLARIIRSPYRNNPRSNYYAWNTPEYINERTDWVLSQMLDQELITRAEYEQAMSEDVVVLRTSSSSSQELYDNIYYVEYAIYDVVTKMLRVEGLEDTSANRARMQSRLRTGGYSIYTSLDPDLQDGVQTLVAGWDGYPKMLRSADSVYYASLGNGEYLELVEPQAAVTVIDWTTGEIQAVIGGRQTPTGLLQTNRAYQNEMPVGSSLKPLSVYGPAIEMGYSPGTPVINAPIKIAGWDDEKGYPSNYSANSYNGCESMRMAINKSHNVAAAYTLMYLVGMDNSVRFLLNLGIRESRIQKTGAGLALGISGISTVEMAAGFGAIANDGVYLEPYAFTEIKNADGSTYIDVGDIQISRRVFSEQTAWLVKDLLIGNCTQDVGTGALANFGGFTVGGKTGTNSDAVGVSFTGITAYYACSVWIGHDMYKPLVSDATGGSYSAPLFAAVMKYVHSFKGITQNKPLNEKTAYEMGLREVTVCGVSGMLPTAACRIDVNEYELITDYYIPGTGPTQTCNRHRTMRLCTRTKQSPSSYCYDTDIYGVIYMPEGHPLRYDSATNVRQYFWGASTSQSSAAVGVCTECASRRGASITNSERDTILSYANRAIADANSLLNSGRLNNDDFNRVTTARNALQLAMDEDSEIEVLRTLVSALKRVNEATHKSYGF